jgi:hypothetical protein
LVVVCMEEVIGPSYQDEDHYKKKSRSSKIQKRLRACSATTIYFSTPSIFSRLSTTPSMRIITCRGKKTRSSRPSLYRSASSSLSAAVAWNRSRCSRSRRARLRARTLRWYRNSCSRVRGSARVIRAKRSDRHARGRREK